MVQEGSVPKQAPKRNEQRYGELYRLLLAHKEHHSKEPDVVKRFDAALCRLEQDKYGYCSECRGEIPVKRLDVYPFATLCTVCKQEKEDAEELEKKLRNQKSSHTFFSPGT